MVFLSCKFHVCEQFTDSFVQQLFGTITKRVRASLLAQVDTFGNSSVFSHSPLSMTGGRRRLTLIDLFVIFDLSLHAV